MARSLLLAGLLTLTLSAGTACTSRASQTARPRSTATVTILAPPAGDVVSGTQVRVRVKLEGGRIIPETRTDLTPDEGHIHLRLDGNIVSMTYGLEQLVAAGKGPHLLEAEFVAADHLPFSPRVISTTTFTVE